MDEKEDLRRQIQRLQDLITSHKNVHGNAPAPRATFASGWRHPTPAAYAVPRTLGGQPQQKDYQQQQPHPRQGIPWRKKYSLVNRPVAPSHHFASSGAAGPSQTPSSRDASLKLPFRKVVPETQAVFHRRSSTAPGVGFPPQNNSVWGTGGMPGMPKASSGDGDLRSGAPRRREMPDVCSRSQSTSLKEREKSVFTLQRKSTAGGGPESLAAAAVSSTACPGAVRSGGHIASPISVLQESIGASSVAVASTTLRSSARHNQGSHSASSNRHPEPRVPATLVPNSDHSGGHCSKATGLPNPKASSSSAQVAPSLQSVNLPKRKLVSTPKGFGNLRDAAPSPASCRASKYRKTKYTWVANPGKCNRMGKKTTSPKAPENAAAVERLVTLKPSPKGEHGPKQRKTNVHVKTGASTSKYKWKATSPLQPVPTFRSVFRWQSEGRKASGAGLPSGTATAFLQTPGKAARGYGAGKPSFSDVAHSAYKVKSRTKLIRRRSSVCSPADRRPSSSSPAGTVKSRYYLRRRNATRGKSPQAVRRTPSRGLVQITKHRLRRLPAPKQHVPVREGCSLHPFRSPSANKVIKSRYRIVKRCAATPPTASLAALSSLALAWKVRRLSAARLLLMNRMHQLPVSSRSPQLQQRWRSRGLRCIGGVMYRVSATKLSKTSSTPSKSSDLGSRSFTRAGRLDGSANYPGYPVPNCPSKSATPSRYIASRAVQRSLAIIRQAKQKKEKKKEYCMYYNRFGKCNRGESCPYIHDPEKVAVCTRFLRGTCKKTDGTCPFSHKVSKDKMPVCSYFLKGICNNNACPYSHVYVSRKAEVCQDFLKGYCPMGEKCKKKHTLLCPDFAKNGSCPKGAQCKLQHRQRKHPRRPFDTSSHPEESTVPAKRRRSCEESGGTWVHSLNKDGAPKLMVASKVKPLDDGDEPGRSGLRKLPSFISLQSSPSSPGDDGVRATGRVKLRDDETGKPLQIKPRL
ncbi:zinc finger CCCH domain-containing protein 3 [Rhinatrema bivittatum]|uniref:zinc finger CCCH domain-containing protein 3 n=1 Tax=Rhinatrema bivittatum TaxID=194408 RepID=UPI00112E60CC|nr:zinc finger CCCH domain-containing protein 3 [Rhinatrema bivittatum]